jgi:COP9 signalosome complex subunit 5
MHARSGGAHEIMGMMQGKIEAETFVVMDAYPLPVEGTETRVSAQNDANEFLVDYNERSKNVFRLSRPPLTYL